MGPTILTTVGPALLPAVPLVVCVVFVVVAFLRCGSGSAVDVDESGCGLSELPGTSIGSFFVARGRG